MDKQQKQAKPPGDSNSHGKRPFPHQRSKLGNKRAQKKVRKRERDMKNGSAEEVLAMDLRNLKISLGQDKDGGDAEAKSETDLPERGTEIEVKVLELSSTGDALAVREGSDSQRIYVFPYGIPGDVARVKVYRHLSEEQGDYTVADFVSVSRPSDLRDDSRVRCKYFASCAGCQYQMLDYAEQLRVKKRIVEKAFANFSDLSPELVPAVGDTIGSPLQYGYRTKLTPHFDGPDGWSSKKNNRPFSKRPDIGFMPKGKRTTLDIEDCPIGTDVVRLGMKSERARMDEEFGKYTRGATLLLRESTERVPKKDGARPEDGGQEEARPNAIKVETDSYVDWKTCVTDNKGTSTEYVGDFVFHNPAGSFFQNNNSILPKFTDYIRQHILPPSSNPSTSTTSASESDLSSSATAPSKPIKNLIDAYSGSGLFTITLSDLFFPEGSSTGIDIAESSIAFAARNAEANNLPWSQVRFIAADARSLFDKQQIAYDPDETVVVLDPPRKGCDGDFLKQLLDFGPKRVVYVSCNVHTQARDVGVLVRGTVEGVDAADAAAAATTSENGGQEKGKGKTARYSIESLCGFDFFPQTGHVEGVAVLNRVDE